MFGRKNARIKALEEKVEELSRINKIRWVRVTDCGPGSPPYYIGEKYQANHIDLVLALMDYFDLEPKYIKPGPRTPSVEICKKKLQKKQ